MPTDSRLQMLVERWIRADYEFRFGRRRYTRLTTDWLLEAEDILRRAITKKKTLKEAHEVLDARVD